MTLASENKMKVCFVAATLGKGGAEKQAYYLIKTLREHKHPVKLIYFEQEDWWRVPICELGVEVVHITEVSKKSRILEAYRLLKKDRFQVVHALHYHMNPYAALLGLMLGAKSVGAFRGDGERELLTVNKYIRSAAFLLGHTFICNSRNTLEKLAAIRILRGKLHYLPNIVELPETLEANRAEAPKKFLAVNSLVALKRVDRILRFISYYRHSQPDVELMVLGDGPLKNQLEAKAQALGLSACVHFQGQVDNVSDYYQQADVFMLASESEGTPNVILEAMSYGKVIVSSRTGETPHLLKEGEYGLLIDFESDEDIENACARLSENWVQLKRTGEMARQVIQEEHGYAHLYGRISNIYQTL